MIFPHYPSNYLPIKKAESMLNRKGLMGLLFFVLLLVPMVAASGPVQGGGRADILEIQQPGRFKMPPVWFPHDLHTRELKDKGCDTCHPQEKGRFMFTFKTAGKQGYKAEMAAYHENCTGCHRKRDVGGKETGPQIGQCRACHLERQPATSSWVPLPFDHSLHFRHINAKVIDFKPAIYDQNCGACHHAYDRKLKRTVYREGVEESCRYCHKEKKIDDVRSYRNAAHTSCLNCHRRLTAMSIKTGPVDCTGCHSREGQANIEKVKEIPRLKWKQPEAVLMSPWLAETAKKGKLPEQRTNPVAFNHIAHEKSVGSCRQCHHATLDPCGKCHTVRGAREGGFIPLETAMHGKESAMACLGCHNQVKQKPECAGCHGQMAERPFADRECRQCHNVDPETLKPLPADEENRRRIALGVIDSRKQSPEMVPDAQIPEKVKIQVMADEYQAAEFPHRKIVRALSERIRNNTLAQVSHQKPETLCMGCHHNSPASLKPPACASCHKLAVPRGVEGRTGLKGAYHGQCISCHTAMHIDNPAAADCTACHKKRSERPGTAATK